MDAQIIGIKALGKESLSEDVANSVAPFSMADLFTPDETRSLNVDEFKNNDSLEEQFIAISQMDEERVETLVNLLNSAKSADEIEANEVEINEIKTNEIESNEVAVNEDAIETNRVILNTDPQKDIDSGIQAEPRGDLSNRFGTDFVYPTEPSQQITNNPMSEQTSGQRVQSADADLLSGTQKLTMQQQSEIMNDFSNSQERENDTPGQNNPAQYTEGVKLLSEKQDVAKLSDLSMPINDENQISQQNASEAPTKTPELLSAGLSDFFSKKIDFSQMGLASKSSSSGPLLKHATTPDYSAALFELKSDESIKANYQIGNYTARIKMYPPELGEINARISIQNGQTSISMMTDDTQVKQIIEMSLPKLRESFEGSNLTLTDVDVQHDKSSEKQKFSDQRGKKEHRFTLDDQPNYHGQEHEINRSGNSIVDIYA